MFWKRPPKPERAYRLIQIECKGAVEVEHKNGEKQYYYHAERLNPFWTYQKELDGCWMPIERAQEIYRRLIS